MFNGCFFSKGNPMSDEFDIFIKNEIFPEAEKIFSFSLSPLQEIKDVCIVVLDTNALLVPYNTGQKSLSEIKATYTNLIKQKRLYIPGQVAREFASNRAEKLKDVYQKFNRKISQIKQFQVGKYPLLESLDEYKESVRIEKNIDELMASYNEILKKVLKKIRGWNWNDPVSLLYNEIFTKEVIYELDLSKENLTKDLKKRNGHNIPPGYKDANKMDQGIGDLIIWQTILKLGEKHKKHLIFASNEGRKGDWRYRIEKTALYPRYELVDEYRRCSAGKSFHILEFSDFLALYGAGDEIINEIKIEESKSYHSNNVALRQNWDDIETTLKSCGAQLIRYPDRKVRVELNGQTMTYYRPKRTQKPIKISFLKEIENFMRRSTNKIF